MRDVVRIDTILAVVRETWVRYPDQRFMQLVYNIYRTANLDPGISGDYFYTEDDDLLEYINGLPIQGSVEGQDKEGGGATGDSESPTAALPPSRKKPKAKGARG